MDIWVGLLKGTEWLLQSRTKPRQAVSNETVGTRAVDTEAIGSKTIRPKTACGRSECRSKKSLGEIVLWKESQYICRHLEIRRLYSPCK
jgi:hypothetical protein